MRKDMMLMLSKLPELANIVTMIAMVESCSNELVVTGEAKPITIRFEVQVIA